jgi:hypothetical protein
LILAQVIALTPAGAAVVALGSGGRDAHVHARLEDVGAARLSRTAAQEVAHDVAQRRIGGTADVRAGAAVTIELIVGQLRALAITRAASLALEGCGVRDALRFSRDGIDLAHVTLGAAGRATGAVAAGRVSRATVAVNLVVRQRMAVTLAGAAVVAGDSGGREAHVHARLENVGAARLTIPAAQEVAIHVALQGIHHAADIRVGAAAAVELLGVQASARAVTRAAGLTIGGHIIAATRVLRDRIDNTNVTR